MKMILSLSFIILPVVIFGILDQSDNMAIGLTAGLACAIFLNMDKFKSFRIGELEAELKDAIEEANATITQLKDMAEPLMDYTLANITRGSRIMGVDAQDEERVYKKMKQNYESFNIQSDYSTELLTLTKNKVRDSYLSEIRIYSESIVGWEKNEEVRNQFTNFLERKSIIPISEIRQVFIQNPECYNETIENKILEYDRFVRENFQ
jgi:hypothetical protein